MSQSSRANNTKQRNRRERLKHRAAASVDGGGKSNESGYSDKVQSPSPKPNAETLSSAPDIFLRGETEAEVKDRGDGDAVHIQSSQKENLVFEAPSLNLADGPVSDSKHMHQDFGRSSENGEEHADGAENLATVRTADLFERSLTTLESESQGGSIKVSKRLLQDDFTDGKTTHLEDSGLENNYKAGSVFEPDQSSSSQPPGTISVTSTARIVDPDAKDLNQAVGSYSLAVPNASKPAPPLNNSSGTTHYNSTFNKKQVRLLDVDDELKETTPLIRPLQPTLEPSLARSAPTNTPLPRIDTSRRMNHPKLHLWVWLLVGGLLLLGNIALLAYLFLQPDGYGSALGKLLSQMDSKQLRMDLENLQTFSKNGADGNTDWVSGKDLANGNYIQEQLALLSNFEVEIQHFLTPQWSLTGVPYVAFYFGLKIPLEHRRDFIVLPFSGEASDLRLLTTSPTLESCSLYNHHVRGRAVVIPYPSSKTHGISMPCPVWDLAYSAQEAGAAAVVLYLQGIDAEFPNFDGLHPALLPPGWRLGGRMIEIPVILLNRVSGELLRSVPFSIDIKVSVSFSLHVSKNIIAKPKLRHHPPHLNPAHQPILIGAHWDSDPLTLNASHFKVTGAAGLLAAARAIDAAAFRLETHPVELVWFGARSPLRLGLLKYLDSLEESTLHPYFYFDLGRLEGERPCQFDIKEIPPTLRQISAKAQRSMNDTIRYGFGHSSKGPIPNPPLYRYDGTLGVPEMTFVEYGVPATGISSSFLANSTNSQVEMVLQLTKVVLIAVDAITK